MSAGTRIEWADASWSCITGCTPISEGCRSCYASVMTHRLQAMGQKKYAAGFDKVVCHPEALTEPMGWKKPKRIFVNSMADTFHNDVPDTFVKCIFGAVATNSKHTFIFLTKRAERMANFINSKSYYHPWPLPNVWLGVTVESQAQLGRIEWLKKTPAAVRFVSFEPLLGHVLPSLKGIDWVIVGAETGPGARHMKLEWAIALRELCKMAHIPFFFKKPSKGDVIPPSLDVHEFPVGCQKV